MAVAAVLAAGIAVALRGQEVALPAVETVAVDVTGASESVAPGWTGDADVDAGLVGIEWQGDPGATFTIDTQDASGAWVPAGTVEALPPDEGPDDGSVDAGRMPDSAVTEPLWIGDGVAAVRVRSGARTRVCAPRTVPVVRAICLTSSSRWCITP